jgi:hypothetical protein
MNIEAEIFFLVLAGLGLVWFGVEIWVHETDRKNEKLTTNWEQIAKEMQRRIK